MTEASFFGTNTQRLLGLGMPDTALCHIALYMSHNSAALLWPCNPICNGLFVARFVILAVMPRRTHAGTYQLLWLLTEVGLTAAWRRFEQFLQAHLASKTWNAKPAPLAALTRVWTVWRKSITQDSDSRTLQINQPSPSKYHQKR